MEQSQTSEQSQEQGAAEVTSHWQPVYIWLRKASPYLFIVGAVPLVFMQYPALLNGVPDENAFITLCYTTLAFLCLLILTSRRDESAEEKTEVTRLHTYATPSGFLFLALSLVYAAYPDALWLSGDPDGIWCLVGIVLVFSAWISKQANPGEATWKWVCRTLPYGLCLFVVWGILSEFPEALNPDAHSDGKELLVITAVGFGFGKLWIHYGLLVKAKEPPIPQYDFPYRTRLRGIGRIHLAQARARNAQVCGFDKD